MIYSLILFFLLELPNIISVEYAITCSGIHFISSVIFTILFHKKIEKVESEKGQSTSDYVATIFTRLWISTTPFILLALFIRDIGISQVKKINPEIFEVLLLIVISIYYGLQIFNFRKKYFMVYIFIWLSLPIAIMFSLLQDSFLFTQKYNTFFKIYSIICGIAMTFGSAIDYVDKKIKEKGGKLKVKWDNIMEYISYDFMDKK